MDRYQLLSIPEVADQLKCGTWFVRNQIKRRKLTAHQLGKRICVSQSDLDLYVAQARKVAHGAKKAEALSRSRAGRGFRLLYA